MASSEGWGEPPSMWTTAKTLPRREYDDAEKVLRWHRYDRFRLDPPTPKRKCYKRCIAILECQDIPPYLRVATLHLLSRVTDGPCSKRNRLTEAKSLLDTLDQNRWVAKMLIEESARLVKWSEKGPEAEGPEADSDRQAEILLHSQIYGSRMQEWVGGLEVSKEGRSKHSKERQAKDLKVGEAEGSWEVVSYAKGRGRATSKR